MLDALFAEARATSPQPSDALMARVLADAAAAARPMPAAPTRRRPGVLRGVAAFFGGGLSLAGMATAAAAGVWIGLAAPSPLSGLIDGGDGTLDLIPDVSAMLDVAGEG